MGGRAMGSAGRGLRPRLRPSVHARCPAVAAAPCSCPPALGTAPAAPVAQPTWRWMNSVGATCTASTPCVFCRGSGIAERRQCDAEPRLRVA